VLDSGPMQRSVVCWTVLFLLGSFIGCAPPSQDPVFQGADIFLHPDTEVIEARVPRNATLAGLLRGHELSDDLVSAIISSAREVFDPRRLRADQPYRLVLTLDGLLRQFDYQIDSDRFLRIVSQTDEPAPAFDVEVVPYRKDRALVALHGEIDAERPSLVAALNAAGETVRLAVAMADLFSGHIDFTSDVQPGDSFELLFEKVLREGEFGGYGAIVAAEFNASGRRYRAFRFEQPGQEPQYYDEEGRSIRRFFLRSPLRFDPVVTSHFSRSRLHPVLRTYRPHWGVDYRAPRGAPVVAVADGTVVTAAFSRGGGNTVCIRHSGGYESCYLHLSAYGPGIRRGARVAQGQLIGRVGSTGVATGPHLDYRLRKNGTWVNPLVEHRKMPPGAPIAPAHLAAFMAERDRALSRMFGYSEPVVATASSEAQDAGTQ
jgi:murein DD-endopeptidase MepM/ murein hydrolase activator NlpD